MQRFPWLPGALSILLFFGACGDDGGTADVGVDTSPPPPPPDSGDARGDAGPDAGRDAPAMDRGTPNCAPGPGDTISLPPPSGFFFGAGRFSPDGTRVAVVSFQGLTSVGFRILDLCGNTLAMFDPGNAPQAQLVWSADGTELIYMTSTGLYRVLADGTGTPALVVAGGRTLDVSPDGSTLVYSDAVDLFTLDLTGAGGVPSALGTSGAFPRYIPDGTAVAYARDDMVYRFTIADTTESPISLYEPTSFQPFDWFSDGGRLVITTATGLAVITDQGTVVTAMEVGAGAMDVDVSPDDSLILYRINSQTPIYMIGTPS